MFCYHNSSFITVLHIATRYLETLQNTNYHSELPTTSLSQSCDSEFYKQQFSTSLNMKKTAFSYNGATSGLISHHMTLTQL